MASLPQDLLSVRAVDGAVQLVVALASGVLGSLLAAGGSVVGVAARVLELVGVVSRETGREDGEAPSLRALEGGMSVRSRRADGYGVEASSPGAARREARLDDTALPESYDEDRVVALPRDPGTVYVYWNVSEATRPRLAEEAAADAGDTAREALRVEVAAPDVEPADAAGGSRDGATVAWTVPLAPLATSAYVDLPQPCHAARVVRGVLQGRTFVPLILSTWIALPAARPAEEAAPTWRQLGSRGDRPVEAPALPSREAREALLRRARESQMATSSAGRAGPHMLETEPGTAAPPRDS